MSREWWKEADRKDPKYSEKKLSHWHFIRHKSHMDCPGTEPQLLWRKAGD